jgi:hypothetical protein
VIWEVNCNPSSAQNCKRDGENFLRSSGACLLMSSTRYFFKVDSDMRCALVSATNALQASSTGVVLRASCWILPAISQSRTITFAAVQSRSLRDLLTRLPAS